MSPAERTRRWRERRARDVPGVTGGDARDVTVTAVETETETETQTAPAARESAIDDHAEEFLRVFPRRGDGDHPRAATLTAFRRAVAAGADPARIVAGAKAYGASVTGRERRFVVSAARWLAEERWPQAAPAPGANAPRIATVWISATSREWSDYADRYRAAKGRIRPSTRMAVGAFRRNVPPRRSNKRLRLTTKQKGNHDAKTKSRAVP